MEKLSSLSDIGLKNSGVKDFVYQLDALSVLSGSFNRNTTIENIEILSASYVEDKTFEGCHSLTSLVLPPIENFSGDIFGDDKPDSLFKVIFQEGTKLIGTTLSGLQQLQSLDLPTTVKELSPQAIDNCYQLREIIFRNDLQLSREQLSSLKNLRKLSFCLMNSANDTDNNFSIGLSGIADFAMISVYLESTSIALDQSVFYQCKASDIVFLSTQAEFGIQSIEPYSFCSCPYLLSLDLSNSKITKVPEYSFASCSRLNSVILPETVTELCSNIFLGTNVTFNSLPLNLKSISYIGIDLDINSIPEAIQVIDDYALSSSKVSQSEIRLPSIKYLGEGAFKGSDIKCISELGDSSNRVEINQCAFADCHQLTSIDLTNVSKIKAGALSSTQLYSDASNQIVIDGVSLIETSSFAGINSDLYVEIDKSTMTKESFQVGVFQNSSLRRFQTDLTLQQFSDNLQDLVGKSLYPPEITNEEMIKIYDIVKNELFCSLADFDVVLKDITYNKSGIQTDYNCLIYSDDEKKNLVECDQTADDYSTFISYPTLLASTECVSDDVFKNNQQLTSINFNGTLSVGSSSFESSQIREVNSNYIKSVGSQAFKDCKRLQDVSLNHTLSIGGQSFFMDDQLTGVSLQSVVQIGDQAFSQCSGIEYLNLDALTSLGELPFEKCNSLTSISLAKLEVVEAQQLNDLTGLKNLNIQNSKILGFGSLSGDTNLSSIDIHSVQTIQNFAFKDCVKLTSLTFPVSLTSIGESIFSGCSELDQVSFNGSIDKLYDGGFLGEVGHPIVVKYPNITLGSIEDKIKSNPSKSPIGTQYITIDKSKSYPSFITKSDNLNVKIINGFIAEMQSGQIVITGSDNSYLRTNTTLEASDFDGIDKISSGAFYSTSLKTMNLPDSWRTSIISNSSWASKIESSPFNGSIFQTMSVNDNYNATVDKNAWSHLFSSCTGSPTIHFLDGILISDGRFITIDDPFIYDLEDNIIGVDDSKASSNQDIPTRARGIARKAFQDSTSINNLAFIAGRSSAQFKVYANAFENNKSISSINFQNCPDASFEDSSFTRSSLIDVIIPHVDDEVSGYGLNRGYSLLNVEYSSGITRVAPSAMIDCTSLLSGVVLPRTLSSIGEYAFAEVIDPFPYIESINFDDCPNLEKIERFAFYNSLKTFRNRELIFPSKLTSIAEASFAYKNRNFSSHNISAANLQGVYELGPSAFQYNTFRKVDFGEGSDRISSIGNYTFANSQYKWPIHIPSSIKSIGQQAFKNNVILNPDNTKANIISIDLPFVDLLSAIGLSGGIGREISEKYQATNFLGLTPNTIISATNQGDSGNYYKDYIIVTVDPRNLANRMLNICPQMVNIDIFTKTMINADLDAEEVFIPSYVQDFSASCFNNCENLVKINNLYDDEIIYFKDPKDYFFNNCKKITNVRVLSTSTSIGDFAFQNCESLEYAYEPMLRESFYDCPLSSIGQCAFSGCTKLQEFTIPPSISLIKGNDVFKNCISLTSIDILMTDEDFKEAMSESDGVYSSVKDLIVAKFRSIRTDNSCRIQFTNAIYTNDGEVKIDHEFLKLYQYGSNLSGLSGLSFSSPYDVRSQTYLNISAVSKVDSYVFDDLQTMYNLNFLSSHDRSLTSIGDYAFYNCQNLETISNNKLLTVKIVGDYAFGKCSLIGSMEFDLDQLESIGKSAFYKSSVKTLTFNTSKSKLEYDDVVKKLKQVIGFEGTSGSDRNPLELLDTCTVIIVFSDGYCQLNYLLDDLSMTTIDINRHTPVFVDKQKSSIKPLVLVESSDDSSLPAIVANTFHAQIIGRWK